jgi:hypothetical protein
MFAAKTMKRILIGLGIVVAILLLGGVWFFRSGQKSMGDYYECQWNREALDIARYWYALDNNMTNAPGLVKEELAPYVQDEKAFTCPRGGIYSVKAGTLHSIPEHMFDTCLGNRTPPEKPSNWLQDYPLDYRNSDFWLYSMDENKDGTTLRMSGATIMFRNLQGWGGGWGTMEVSGSGTSSGSSSSGDRVFIHSYADGVCTVSIAGHLVRVTDHGRSLQIDKSTFDLSRNRPRIVVDTNGAAQVEAPGETTNKTVQRTGASRFVQETNQTSSAAGSRR